LFVNGQLFEKKKTNKNQLILTLADDYKTTRHLQNVLTNLKYLYNNSISFSKAFALPYAHDNSIYLTLGSHQRKIRIDEAFDTIVAIILDSISQKNSSFEPEQPESESESEQPQIVKSVVKKRDRRSTQLSINEAFEKGKLFQSVKISKMGVTFEIADAFNSKKHYRFISQRLNTQLRSSQALADVALPIKDFRRKPSLRLKANHQLTAEKLLNLFKTPTDTEKEALAITQPVTQAPEVAIISAIEAPITTITPFLETTEISDVTASSPEIIPETTPDSDDLAFEGLDEMLQQLTSTNYRSSYLDLDSLFACGTEDYLWDLDNSNQDNNLFFQYGNSSRGDLLPEEWGLSSSLEQNNLFLSMSKTRNV
ncbi:MAG TPA: hypothetical protein PLD88_14410, partial [Candidatus Berkiella sp.]|nr:hypothetical protein [Candidatus Berkiella sp.]